MTSSSAKETCETSFKDVWLHLNGLVKASSGVEHMGASMSFGLDRMVAPTDQVCQTIEYVGSSVEHMGPAFKCIA